MRIGSGKLVAIDKGFADGSLSKNRPYIDRSQYPATESSTPPELFERLDVVFGPFSLDAAANCGQHGTEPANFVCEPYLCNGCHQDGLTMSWSWKTFVNPPYDKGLPAWVEKAVSEINRIGGSKLVVMLLPVRTGRPWWQNVLIPTVQHMIYLPGRLRFKGAKNSAPFDSALAIWWSL